MTEGEKRVRVDFNVNNDSEINAVKTFFADRINRLLDVKKEHFELGTLVSIRESTIDTAIIKLEDACMWAVKSIT